MKKVLYLFAVAFLVLAGCSKVNDELAVNPNEPQLKSGRVASPIGSLDPGSTSLLETGLYSTPATYNFSLFPGYDFSRYLNGGTVYIRANYDVMAHFVYISPKAITGAVVEFTFPHIEYFVPHMNNVNQERIYTVNNADNQTVITCTTNLIQGRNPMFCFLVKVDCGKEGNGYTTFWTDMKVDGVSVKGTNSNKVFKCN